MARRLFCAPRAMRTCARLQIALRLLPGCSRGVSLLWSSDLHARAAGLGQADGDRLLGVPTAVLTLLLMMHFLANKFTRLCCSGFTLSFISPRTFCRSFFRHAILPAKWDCKQGGEVSNSERREISDPAQ
jgi:hypothetical protein